MRENRKEKNMDGEGEERKENTLQTIFIDTTLTLFASFKPEL